MTLLGEKLREALDKDAVIQRTLNAWDTHEEQIRKPQQEKKVEQHNFRVSNNVMRATFDAVKNAPNMQISEYIDMLICNGFKRSSVSSVLYQLVRVGQIKRDDNGALTVAQEEYTPLKPMKKEVKPERKVVMITRRKSEDKVQGIAALKADTVVKAEGAPFDFAKHKAFIPSQIVDNLSVLHARELYDYLRKIFTGEIK